MNTFSKFLETKLFSEDAPGAAPLSGGAGGISSPGALPGGAMGAGAPPMGGGMGMPMGGGMPPMGGMPGAAPPGGGGQAPEKLKAYNVWDVLERVLSGDGHEEE